MPRKIISISAAHVKYTNERKGYDESYTILYGVGDDGTLWQKVGEFDWEQIETIPE